MANRLPRVGITMGDAAGIGPEITLKSLAEPDIYTICNPVVLGDARVMEAAADLSGIPFEIQSIGTEEMPEAKPGLVNVIDYQSCICIFGICDISFYDHFGPLSRGIVTAEDPHRVCSVMRACKQHGNGSSQKVSIPVRRENNRLEAGDPAVAFIADDGVDLPIRILPLLDDDLLPGSFAAARNSCK